MEGSRVQKSIKNTSFGMIGMALSIIVQFVSRTVFIELLGAEYNGINGLFTNILQVLNLAELGFAHSVAFALYSPLSTKDEKKISAIMNFLRSVYKYVAIIVLIAGFLCIPFLQYFIKEDISNLSFNLKEIRLFFVIYLFNTVFSYVYSYKRTIITADQHSYLVFNVDNASNILLYIVQIVLLFVLKNYYLYLVLMAIKTLISNIILTGISNKFYPYLDKNKGLKLDKAERNVILKNVGAMFFHKVGSVLIFSTTTIIISAFVGFIEASKYTNYILIVNAVSTFISILFNAITSSVGNLCAEADKEYQYKVFKRISYLCNFLVVVCFTCYVGLFTPFVKIWLREDMILDKYATIAISLCAVASIIRNATLTFKTAMGLFTEDWFKPLVESLVGIGLAILFSFKWGTCGVVMGYTISSLLVALPIENIVLFKYGLGGKNKKLVVQFIRLASVIVLSFITAFIGMWLCSLLGDGLINFAIKAIICVAVASILYLAITFRTDGCKYYVRMFKGLIVKIFKKLKKSS